MARVLYGEMISDMRGKVNGTVHSRNKGGAYMRTKVTPINPNTSHQSLQRAYTSDLSKAWGNVLTDAQRQGWSSFGQVIGARSIFGNNQILSGIATYLRINKIILAAGGTRIDDAPVDQNVGSITSLALTANHTGPVLSLAFTPTPLVAPSGLYLFATPALPAGISNVSTRLRLIGYTSAATSPLNILTAWQTRFGTFPTVAGQRIAVSAAVVDISTGAISAASGTGTLVI